MPRTLFLWIGASLVALAGCDEKVERFEPNDVFAVALTKTRQLPIDAAKNDVTAVVANLFGSPDNPRWPSSLLHGEAAKTLVAPVRLERAAGPVFSERDGRHGGMYREHCVGCHGLSGSGAGPTSRFQAPYPRDFRHGVFKWKRTSRAAKPTREDLREVLRRGIPGTAMPSFAAIEDDDLEAIIDYVVFLSVRGEVERELLAVAVDELGYEATPPGDDFRLIAGSISGSENMTEGGETVESILNDVVDSWVRADDSVVPVPELPVGTPERPASAESKFDERASVERGREIFHGAIANCAACHGLEGDGDVTTFDYDDWAKDYSTRVGLTPGDRVSMAPMREAGALPPRPIEPRVLQRGVYRGGDDPATLYRRITQGIAGTPMPGIEISQQPGGTGLTKDQVWDLVRYIRSLDEG